MNDDSEPETTDGEGPGSELDDSTGDGSEDRGWLGDGDRGRESSGAGDDDRDPSDDRGRGGTGDGGREGAGDDARDAPSERDRDDTDVGGPERSRENDRESSRSGDDDRDAPSERGDGESSDGAPERSREDAERPKPGGRDGSSDGGGESSEADDEDRDEASDRDPLSRQPASGESSSGQSADSSAKDSGDDGESPRDDDEESERATAPEDSGEERAELEGESVLPIRREYVEDLLTDLGDIAEERGFDSLHDEVYQDRIPALREGRMSVVVLGEFNHGKSTVVNALLGESVLPTGITPTTSEITHLVHADEPTVTLQPTGDAEVRTIDYDELDEAVTEEEEEEQEDLEHVEIGYPNHLLEDSLVLVDTPGVNDISRQKVEITYGYVPRADVILYVLDATQILKKSEITFIEEKLLEANRDRIIFVLGKIDALDDQEAEEVEEYARERLESLIGPVDLYPFSGRAAIEALERGEEPSDAFLEFKSDLLAFLREQKAEIIIDSALGGGLRIASMLEQNLAIERQAYRLEKEELEERIRRVRSKLEESQKLIAENLDLIDERIGGIAATARHNLHAFRDEFLESLPQQIEQAEARDVQLYLSAWIQDQFKEWLETEGTEIAHSLEELAEEVIEVTNESIQETVEAFRDEFGLHEQLDLEVDTVAYDMSVFALGGVGLSVLFLANTLVGGLLTAATPVLAMFFKGRVDEKIKERAREEGRRAIREASDAIEEELMDVIYEYGDRLEEFVETAGDRLYRQVQEALAQVQRERDRKDREEALEEVDERVERVRRIAEKLQSSREQLRGQE